MSDKEFLNKYEELLNKDYCNCNEMNCIDNNSPRRILNIAKSQQDEIERLNNIINELDNWLGKKILSWEDDGNVSDNIYHERLAIQMIYFKLQELKGDDKE